MPCSFHPDGTLPAPSATTFWVFGSNLAGRHGKGAAEVAVRQFDAKRGCGVGFAGQSFAIPTKDASLRVLPLETIRIHVDLFLEKARTLEHLFFFVTRIGCGLAGYRDDQIAPMFAAAPANCSFAEQWRPYLDSLPAYDIKL